MTRPLRIAICYGIFAAALPAVLGLCMMAYLGAWRWAGAVRTLAPAATMALYGGLVLWSATRPPVAYAFLGLAGMLAFFSSLEFVGRFFEWWFEARTWPQMFFYNDVPEMISILLILVVSWPIIYYLALRIKREPRLS